MRIILRWLAKLNLWFENLAEPKRFAVSLCYGLLPFMCLATFAEVSGEGIFTIFGLLWILIFVVAYRAWWLYGNLKDYLNK